jgi:hypothetical protein
MIRNTVVLAQDKATNVPATNSDMKQHFSPKKAFSDPIDMPIVKQG